MKILASVKLSPHKYKTPEGYLVCQDAILARTGPQTYMESELYEDSQSDALIEVDRKAEQVFDERTMSSFEQKPICCEHPDVNVGPDNYNELAVGHTFNIRKKTVDGQEVMIGDLMITDPQCIEDIENGYRTDLSCGYDCDITDGPNPEQINIRGNHIALCTEGRAGIARIVDSAPKKSGWVKPVQDSIGRGSLIQEFGKQGKQYKITKISGNVIYAQELNTGKIVLFKKDEENVEWASITKSEVRDAKVKDYSCIKRYKELKEKLKKEGSLSEEEHEEMLVCKGNAESEIAERNQLNGLQPGDEGYEYLDSKPKDSEEEFAKLKEECKKIHEELWRSSERSHMEEESQKLIVDMVKERIKKDLGLEFKEKSFEKVYGGSDKEGSWYWPTYTLENEKYEIEVSFSGGYNQYVSIRAYKKESAKFNDSIKCDKDIYENSKNECEDCGTKDASANDLPEDLVEAIHSVLGDDIIIDYGIRGVGGIIVRFKEEKRSPYMQNAALNGVIIALEKLGYKIDRHLSRVNKYGLEVNVENLSKKEKVSDKVSNKELLEKTGFEFSSDEKVGLENEASLESWIYKGNGHFDEVVERLRNQTGSLVAYRDPRSNIIMVRKKYLQDETPFSKNFYKKAVKMTEKELENLEEDDVELKENKEFFENHKKQMKRTLKSQLKKYREKENE